MISVIIPIHESTLKLNKLREQFAQVKYPIEVILVVNKNLKTNIIKNYAHEKVIAAKRKGRGFSLVEGAHHAKGDIILFLHADTILPSNWGEAIKIAMDNDNIIGGSFSLCFDEDNKYLKFLIFLLRILFLTKKEIWGDHAIFIRSQFLKEALQVMNIPLMEDISLSNFMKKKGKVIMLKDKVTTSAKAFKRYGLLGNTFRITKTRLMYALGKNPEEIYEYYYTKNEKSKTNTHFCI